MFEDTLRAEWADLEKQLRAGDVILVHERGFWLTRMIQRVSQSYWNHAALVFMSQKGLPVGGPLIAEASYGGIEIHQLKIYTDQPDRYDIGVLRYPGMTDELREHIAREFILGNLDVTYDYGRLTAFLLGPVLQRISPKLWTVAFKATMNRQRFVCTTFVHRAFHDVDEHHRVQGFVETHDRVIEALENEEFITPGDIAADPTFEWIYNKRV